MLPAIRTRGLTRQFRAGIGVRDLDLEVPAGSIYGFLGPWSMPLQVLAGKGQWADFVITAGVVGGLLVGLAGLLDFRRREFA